MTDFLIRKWVKNYTCTQDAAVRGAYGRLASFTGIACNLVVAIGKILLGLLAGSVSIAADGFNNLSDASASVISYVGFRLAGRPADKEHPYGHGRYEYLTALVVAILVAVIGVELFKSGVEKIIEPESVSFGWLTVVVLSVSVVIKLWMYLFYRKIGKMIDSGTLLAAATDSRNDVITTLAVLVGALLSHYTSLELDGYVGLGVAIFILYSSYGMICSTLDPMLGAAPDPAVVEQIRQKISQYPEVLGVHDLLLHDYGPGRQFGSVHVEMSAEGDVILHHDIIDSIERECLKDLGLHIIIHYDPIVTSDSATKELRQWLKALVHEVDPTLTIHDLRAAGGDDKLTLVFDVAAPYSLAMTDPELKGAIRRKVNEAYPNYTTIITVDRIQPYMPH